MPAIRKTVVISDQHVSAGDLDDCDAELEEQLVRFVGDIGSPEGEDGGVELVINGDFLDFAQAPPLGRKDLRGKSKDGLPLCFTEQQSLLKLRAIHNAHKNVFAGLTSFLAASEENSLVVIPGNHDADFYWPKVRIKFLSYLDDSVAARARFHLDQVYRPPQAPGAWIEHGHQHDPCNNFAVNGEPCWSEASPPIFLGEDGCERLLECVGTRFLLQFLNKLDERYPYVDNVKPFSRFLALFGMSALRPGRGTFEAALSIWSMMRFVAETVVKRPTDLLGVVGDPDKEFEHPLRAYVSVMSTPRQGKLQKRLQDAGLDVPYALATYLKNETQADACMDFLVERPEIIEEFEGPQSMLSVGGQAGTLTLTKGFLEDESKLLIDAAKEALRDDNIKVVVMGHTHVTKDRPMNHNYFNSGCWIRYFLFEPTERMPPWSMLKAGAEARFPYELNYVVIPSENPSAARLETFASEARR